jgi:hypothetical protein
MRSHYSDMVRGRFSHPTYFCHTEADFGFYQLMVKSGVRDKAGDDLSKIDEMKGKWKFHLSIAAHDVPRAWDTVAETLINHPYAALAKVAKPDVAERLSDSRNLQAGKHITIYTYDAISPSIYKRLLQGLEIKLDAAGITPGPQSHTDRIVQGSKYTSYRTDEGPNGEYVSSSSLAKISRNTRHNPWNTPDPYIDFGILPPSLMNMAWQRAVTLGGDNIIRLPLAGLSEQAAENIETALSDFGFSPIRHKSESLGETIRLADQDFYRFTTLQKLAIS